jgi:hypothetical protein
MSPVQFMQPLAAAVALNDSFAAPNPPTDPQE